MCTQAPSTQRDQPLQRSRMRLLVTGGIGDGRGTGNDEPIRDLGVTLHVHDAARALLSALRLPSGTSNVCSDGERVSNDHFTQAARWHPEH
jgi:hypothetical protein